MDKLCQIMPDYFFTIPDFMPDQNDHINYCLLVIFVITNEALKFFTSFSTHVECISNNFLIKTVLEIIFITVSSIKLRVSDKSGISRKILCDIQDENQVYLLLFLLMPFLSFILIHKWLSFCSMLKLCSLVRMHGLISF